MAGGFLAALSGGGPGFFQGMQSAQQAYDQRQQHVLQLQEMRQQLAEQERQRQARTMLGFALLQGGGAFGGAPAQSSPMMAGPQAPMPGAASRPAQTAQPGFAPPLPGAPQMPRTAPGRPTPLLSDQQIIRHESGGNPNIGWGGTGQKPIDVSGYPLDPQGFPQRPALPGPQGPSTASGLYGITKSTWDEVAPQVAQRIGRMPQFTNTGDQKLVKDYLQSTRGNQPWASWAGGGGGQQQQQLPQPQSPPPPQGYNLTQLARQLKAANPSIDGETLMLALDQYVGLMDKTSQRQWEAFKFATEEQDKAAERTLQGRRLDEDRHAMLDTRQQLAGWQVFNDPSNNKPYRFQPSTGQAFDFQGNPYTPGGATRVGGAQSQPLPQLQYPDKWDGMPDKPPPGVDEAVWDNALVFARTHQMPALGFQPGMRNQIIQAYPAALHALGIAPSQAPDIAAAYAGERHGEIVGGGRAAQIGLGIREAEQAAPQVIETSKQVPRTQFPSVNSFTNWLQQQGGGANIVAFREALNTYLNVYASVVSRTGRLTDAQQRHAYELLSTSMNEGQIERGIQQLNYEMELMQGAIEPAMGDITQIGQPPAMRRQQSPAASPQATPQQQPAGQVIRLDENGNVIQ